MCNSLKLQPASVRDAPKRANDRSGFLSGDNTDVSKSVLLSGKKPRFEDVFGYIFYRKITTICQSLQDK